ncbi:MAG: threonylcarbamoyl-AMP synthase [Chloroflexi bacterium]|nr:threonylcarbamoyl-AMP synthase [Chloroflexota bacterium]
MNESPLGLLKQVEKGIIILKQGGVIAFPTDTLYGLGAIITDARAVERVFELKGRPRQMALPILLSDVAQISDVARSVSATAWLLAISFMPGALTLVLAKAESVPDIVTGGSDTIAVRVPAHPIPITIIRSTMTPITGTSANISGQPSPVTAAEVCAQLGDRLDLIIDAGPCPLGKESTVVDVTGEVPVVLREGAVTREALNRICPVL